MTQARAVQRRAPHSGRFRRTQGASYDEPCKRKARAAVRRRRSYLRRGPTVPMTSSRAHTWLNTTDSSSTTTSDSAARDGCGGIRLEPGSATLPVRIARRRGRQMICSSGATACATGPAAHMAPRVSRRGAPKQPHGRRAARHPRSPINLPSPKGRPTVPTRPLTSPHIDHQRPRLRTRPPEDSMHSRTHPSRAFTARSCHHRR